MHYELTSQELRLEGHHALPLSDFFGLTASSLGFDLWTMLLNRSHNGFLTFTPDAPKASDKVSRMLSSLSLRSFQCLALGALLKS